MSGLRGATAGQVEAQAKINLRLRILAREASGFHQLETLFLRLMLADTVRVRRTPRERSLHTSGDVDTARLGPSERNLAWRAADAYYAAAGWSGGFAIELEKRIPIGGGLGGGSADAGGVLRILDAIAPAPLGQDRLLAIAGSLGADIPFLASEHAYALAWGRGERMLALQPPEPRSIVLVVPPVAVNTAEAYRWLAESREPSGGLVPVPEVLDVDALGDWSRLATLAVNDFELVVGTRHPMIPQIVADLRDGTCDLAMMSGSGSVVFGVLPRNASFDPDPADASQVLCTFTGTDVEPVRMLD